MKPAPDESPAVGERLQKVLARAGLGSRRKCEVLIESGRVSVNGEPVTAHGLRVDPASDEVRVDGRLIPTGADLTVLALNKPKGMLSTMSDDRGRPCVGHLVRHRQGRLFHVGRLDADTTGLLLLTNDGPLAHRLQHPGFGVSKTYRATVTGPVPRRARLTLLEGVTLEDGVARADAFRVVSEHGMRAMVEIELHEGRKHIVRRMLAEVGHPVIDLVRLRIGPVRLGSLRPGEVRELSDAEVRALYAASDPRPSTSRGRRRT